MAGRRDCDVAVGTLFQSKPPGSTAHLVTDAIRSAPLERGSRRRRSDRRPHPQRNGRNNSCSVAAPVRARAAARRSRPNAVRDRAGRRNGRTPGPNRRARRRDVSNLGCERTRPSARRSVGAAVGATQESRSGWCSINACAVARFRCMSPRLRASRDARWRKAIVAGVRWAR